MISWPRVALGDVAELTRGVSYSGAGLGKPGPLLVGMGEVTPDGRINLESARSYGGRVKPEHYLGDDDVALVMTDLTQSGRLLGSPARRPASYSGDLVISHHLQRARFGPELNPEFARYLFAGPHWRSHVDGMATGTTVRAVSTADASRFTFGCPPLHEQRAVAEMLGALDDKLDSNRRTISKAREFAALVVRDAMANDSSSVSVAELGTFVNGGAYTKDATGAGRMVIRIAELNGGPGPSTVYNDLVVPEDRVARPGDILMSWSGSLGAYVWARPEAIVNQHIFKVICDEYPPWLVFDRLQAAMPEFRQIAADKATTMGHIKRHHLDDVEVSLPGANRLDVLDDLLAPLWRHALACEMESLRLAALRDALLPELVSGRMSVRDAEAIAEGVA